MSFGSFYKPFKSTPFRKVKRTLSTAISVGKKAAKIAMAAAPLAEKYFPKAAAAIGKYGPQVMQGMELAGAFL